MRGPMPPGPAISATRTMHESAFPSERRWPQQQQVVVESHQYAERSKGPSRFGLVRSATVAGTKALRRPFTSSGPTEADSAVQRARVVRSPDLIKRSEGTDGGRATTSNGFPAEASQSNPCRQGYHAPMRSGTLPPTLLDRRLSSMNPHLHQLKPLLRVEVAQERQPELLAVPLEEMRLQPPTSASGVALLEPDSTVTNINITNGDGAQLKRSKSKWNPFSRSKSRRVKPADISRPVEQTEERETYQDLNSRLTTPPAASGARLEADLDRTTTVRHSMLRSPALDRTALTPNSLLKSPYSEIIISTRVSMISPASDRMAPTPTSMGRSPSFLRFIPESDRLALAKIDSMSPASPPSPSWSMTPSIGKGQEEIGGHLLPSPIALEPPTLQIDIPNSDLERYSVMFGDVLDQEQEQKTSPQDGGQSKVEESEMETSKASEAESPRQPPTRRSTEPLIVMLPKPPPTAVESRGALKAPILMRSNTTPAKRNLCPSETPEATQASASHVATQKGHAKPATSLGAGISQRLVSRFNRSEQAPVPSSSKALPSRSMSLRHNIKHDPSRRFALPPVPRNGKPPLQATPEDVAPVPVPMIETPRIEVSLSETSETETPKTEAAADAISLRSFASSDNEDSDGKTHGKIEIFVARSISVARRPQKMVVPKNKTLPLLPPPSPKAITAETEAAAQTSWSSGGQRPAEVPPCSSISSKISSKVAAHPGPLTSHRVMGHPGPLTSHSVQLHPGPLTSHSVHCHPGPLTSNRVHINGHLGPLTSHSVKASYRHSTLVALNEI